MNPCGGLLRPVRADVEPKRGYMIVHVCEKCGATVRNRAATDAKVQPDDLELVIGLTAGEYRYQKNKKN